MVAALNREFPRLAGVAFSLDPRAACPRSLREMVVNDGGVFGIPCGGLYGFATEPFELPRLSRARMRPGQHRVDQGGYRRLLEHRETQFQQRQCFDKAMLFQLYEREISDEVRKPAIMEGIQLCRTSGFGFRTAVVVPRDHEQQTADMTCHLVLSGDICE